MMSKKEYCVIVVCMLSVLETLLLTGCGVEDKALVLTPRSVMEEGSDADTEITGNDGAMLVWGDSVPVDDMGGTAADPGNNSNAAATSDAVIYVHVCGAVISPGVVELPAGSRAEAALEAAGGFADDAQRDYVNLASRLEDEQQLYIPTMEEAAALRQTANEAEQLTQQMQSGIVNINTANVEALCTLPGIGEARAQSIIDYREQYGAFKKIEDIMQVPGIKESAFSKICDRIVVN